MWTRAADQEWIDAVCRQLTRVTGWPAVYAPSPPPEGASAPVPLGIRAFSWMCEISDGDRTVGTLGVVLPEGRELDDSFLRACESADLIAQLVQRILVQQSAAAGLRTATPATNRPGVSSEATDADPWTQAVNRVLDVVLRLTGLRAAALLVADPQNDCLRLRAGRTHDRRSVASFDRPLGEPPFDLKSLRNKPIVICRQDSRFSDRLPDSMSFGVCYGIHTNESLCGTLWVFDRRDRRLTPREQQILESIVIRLGEFIERAVLVEESALQRQLRSELRIASETQAAQQVSSERLGGWCRLTGRLETVREVGGDLCEVFPLSDQRLLLAIGDAAGHSVPAAMIMATVRGALRMLAEEPRAAEIRPEHVVARLNRVLHGVVEASQFMTLACALIDRGEQTIRLANAGHPPPLLIRDGEVHELEQCGLLLGVVADAAYDSRVMTLEPRDVLVFYTDGITEARGKHRQLFRSSGISDVVCQHADKPPDDIVSHVWDALETHLAADDHDDRTLLVVQIGEHSRQPTEEREVVGTAAD